MSIQERIERKFFAAANTGSGFHSYYGEIFPCDKFDKIIIVKGGCGTGKSSFLRSFAHAAGERGAAVEYFYCSADANSLDGVIAQFPERRIAALDGTAPHLRDTELPGSCDEIHNVGAYWNSDALTGAREEIEALCLRRNAGYRAVYHYLAAAKSCADAGLEIISENTDFGKMRAATERLFRSFPRGNGYHANFRLLDSFGMDGAVHFDSFAEFAQSSYRVVGEGASLWLGTAHTVAQERGLPVVLSPAQLDPTCLGAILLPTCGVSFTTAHRGEVQPHEKVINMERFATVNSREERLRLRRALHERRAALECAAAEFTEIKPVHFALEKIYSSAMDFRKKSKDEQKLIAKVLG